VSWGGGNIGAWSIVGCCSDEGNQLAPPHSCGGECAFNFQNSNGAAGVELTTSDIRLLSDDATFAIANANAGVYQVTVVVVPASPVQLEVNG
jgi:hypothetical protein